MVVTPIRHRRIVMASVAAALLAGASSSAMAGAFGLREQSATGQGMSFAGMAAGGGDSISGMFWNPAVVNQVTTFQSEQHVTGVFPSSKIDVSDATRRNIGAVTGGTGATGDSGDIGQGALLAAGYNAYRISDKVAVGLAVTSPFGLVTDPHGAWGGQVLARSSKVMSVNVSPTLGVTLTDWLSIAGGVQIQYFDIRLRRATGLLPTSPSATLTGDDVGFGFTAGFTVTPAEGTSIGVGFRSAIKHKLEGKLKTPEGDSKIDADVTLPETVSVGVRQAITPDLTILGGVEWTNWSRLGTINVKARNGGATLTSLPFEYEDGWFFSAGAEYAFSPQFTGRAGVGYELSPITNKNRDVRLPDDDRWWLSAGGAYNYSDRLSFDLGYSYVFVPGRSKIDVELPAPLPFNFEATSKSNVHIVSASVRYKFGGEAAPVLVTKY
ncbi:long-chain fatty acid transport protein [Methylopila capsulata]|uniref:Fatty acid transporter n=1 Tax=Methylopila capsulata TaxID=61654 RepID=A0A9W6MRR6_9HYPH|nr:OmpP1/FadL family transporter [Methylopila capsulata]MBM7850234.1 long-chain fatty acid transport protein [Methylopila capsulata]GLK55527.1 fatty acid transporter [Methylopila capsulata]